MQRIYQGKGKGSRQLCSLLSGLQMPYVLSMLDCRHLKCMSLLAGCGLTLYFSHVFNPQLTPLAPKEAAARSLHNCKCGILAGSLTFLGEP